MIVPGNMSEVSALIGTAMTLLKGKTTLGYNSRLPERWMSGLSRTPGKRV